MSTALNLYDGQLFRPGGPWSALPDHPAPGVASLLLTEAAILDDWQLESWLAMFCEACVYWIPTTFDAADPTTQVNLIFDNRALLEDRVFRLQSGQVPSQDPPSRTVRGLSGIMTAPVGADDELLVRSTFFLHEHRPRSTRSYHGRLVHRLRSGETGWQIVGKKVSLLNSDDPLPSLTFLL